MTITQKPTQTPIPEGSLIVTTDTSANLAWWRASEYPKGTRAIVEDYVSAEDAEDGHAFYWASSNGGLNNVVIAAEHAQLMKTPKQLAQSRVPSTEVLKEYLGSALLGDGDSFDITETDRSEDERTVAIYGRTDDGLSFGVHLTFSEPFETDC